MTNYVEDEFRLEEAIQRIKKTLLKLDSKNFQRAYRRNHSALNIEFYLRNNAMEKLFLEFEEWAEEQIQLKKGEIK